MSLNVDFVELSVRGFTGDVCLHLHGYMPGQDGEEEALLLLVLPLGGQPRLDALPGLHEGLSLGHFAGVVGEHPSDVGAQEQHRVAAHLRKDTSQVTEEVFENPNHLFYEKLVRVIESRRTGDLRNG